MLKLTRQSMAELLSVHAEVPMLAQDWVTYALRVDEREDAKDEGDGEHICQRGANRNHHGPVREVEDERDERTLCRHKKHQEESKRWIEMRRTYPGAAARGELLITGRAMGHPERGATRAQLVGGPSMFVWVLVVVCSKTIW